MMFPEFALASNGRVLGVDTGTVNSRIGAQGYVDGEPLMSETAPAASDNLSGGFAYSAGGALRIKDATSALPAGTSTIGGFAVTAIGQLCVVLGTVGAGSFTVAGVAVTADGRVYVRPFESPPESDFLLLESGDFLLLEDGGRIELESA